MSLSKAAGKGRSQLKATRHHTEGNGASADIRKGITGTEKQRDNNNTLHLITNKSYK